MGKVLGIAEDATEPAAADSVEEKLRLAIEACPSGMVLIDGAGTIALVNAETERLFGYRRSELIGRPMEILIPERLRDKHLRHRRVFAAHPQTRHAEASRNLFGLRRDGTEFPAEIGLNPIHSRDGLLVLCVITDIGDRKRVDQLKDEFVSTVSHELRTPLTSISGSLGLLVGGAAGSLPEPALRLLTIAQNNSQRLVRLINDILDVEKIESGQIVFNFKRLDARSLIEQVIEATRIYADGFGVQVRLEPASTPADVYADADRLAQVITNLLSNAIKFSPPSGEVIVAIDARADGVRISIRDHGSGIPAEFKPRVFEKFAQADATDARQKGGTGLGLSIVKQIVTRLGGVVGFDDAPGGGTVFHVELPGWAQIVRQDVDTDQRGLRILLCEDDPDAASALRDGLHPFGFSTDFARHSADAIARAKRDRYAAIVIDFELPDADGANFIRRLREQPEIYKTPIVILSAARKVDRNEISDVLEWVEKPPDIERLSRILEGAVSHEANGRPRILHVDDDPDVLGLVAQALAPTATVVSADSIEAARRALMAQRFDLAVLDISVGPASGLDLLPDLRSRKGMPIPVIVFSAHGAELAADPQVEANLTKSRAALDALVAAVHDRLRLRSPEAAEEMQ